MAVTVTETPVTDALDSAIELPIRRTDDNESKLFKESTIPDDKLSTPSNSPPPREDESTTNDDLSLFD
eukprot:CAMPEP_0171031834 /NCGR_PEP_ID=MMETSP0736-20130129/37906_1 /TAXON_ID=186038 /ORGANISM="Fragilariopsis kerguelensis, Strain L26-C5" /LENGTH=67 /DNA_ID=CAMNT_0011474221 /DNA_START=438 /DNA_END=638 /DNA_ORIENTATION=-